MIRIVCKDQKMDSFRSYIYGRQATQNPISLRDKQNGCLLMVETALNKNFCDFFFWLLNTYLVMTKLFYLTVDFASLKPLLKESVN